MFTTVRERGYKWGRHYYNNNRTGNRTSQSQGLLISIRAPT